MIAYGTPIEPWQNTSTTHAHTNTHTNTALEVGPNKQFMELTYKTRSGNAFEMTYEVHGEEGISFYASENLDMGLLEFT